MVNDIKYTSAFLKNFKRYSKKYESFKNEMIGIETELYKNQKQALILAMDYTK